MHPITRKALSRRTLLRGAGATVALPFLEAMLPTARAASAKLPVRMAFLFMPNGVRQDRWTPEGTGRDWTPSPMLSPLAGREKDVSVFTNFGNRNSIHGDGHYAKTANWLTGTPISKTTGADLRCGISVDQVYANQTATQTRFPSLELGIEPVETGVDFNVNYTKLYGSYISWRNETTPVPSEIDPRAVFDRFFRATPNDTHRTATEDRSVLDLVLEDARRLRGSVGREDQARLDEYLQSLREIETRVDASVARGPSGERPADQKAAMDQLGKRIAEKLKGVPLDSGSRPDIAIQDQVRLMLDLMALAFRTDSTRVSTFMFGWAVSSLNYTFLDGVHEGSFHEVSHHQGKKSKLDQYEKIGTWHVAQYRYLLDQLAKVEEGEGTLLDNSLILFGSSMRDGNSHNPRNLPIVVGGRGGGYEPGMHVVGKGETRLCNLYAGMLQRAGVEQETFGDSDGVLL